jgi:hypothetical protein
MALDNWLIKNRKKLPIVLSNDLLERVVYCCRGREMTDGDIPLITPELMCIKDTDGLDRVRIHDLDPDYLRSEHARLLVRAAWGLYRATKSADDAWEAALTAASRKGYL